METATMLISREYCEGNIDEVLQVLSGIMKVEVRDHPNRFGRYIVEFINIEEEESA